LAIIDAFEELRHLFEGTQHITAVYTDHTNLEYFMSARVLNRRQARWSMSLSRFDFVITYRLGNLQALQDDPFVENIKKRLHANEINDEFEFKDGLFYFNGILYIPPGPTRLKIFQMRHDLPVAGYFGFNKTMELISRDF
jgi:hypothetical protein